MTSHVPCLMFGFTHPLARSSSGAGCDIKAGVQAPVRSNFLTAHVLPVERLASRSGTGVPHHDAELDPSREAPSSVPDLHIPELHIHPTSRSFLPRPLPNPPNQVPFPNPRLTKTRTFPSAPRQIRNKTPCGGPPLRSPPAPAFPSLIRNLLLTLALPLFLFLSHASFGRVSPVLPVFYTSGAGWPLAEVEILPAVLYMPGTGAYPAMGDVTWELLWGALGSRPSSSKPGTWREPVEYK